jgi:hypothetical protein
MVGNRRSSKFFGAQVISPRFVFHKKLPRCGLRGAKKENRKASEQLVLSKWTKKRRSDGWMGAEKTFLYASQ